MPAYTQEMAQKLYDAMPQSEKTKVDAIGGPSIEWFTNAVNAGVPDAVRITGRSRGVADQDEGYTGEMADFSDAADASEWMGKRKPTPAELRKWAADQHASYVSGDKSAQDEDYERFHDAQLSSWIDKYWDTGRGGFFSSDGSRIGKPTETGGPLAPAGGVPGAEAGGGGKAPVKPPDPTTFGNQLSMTGNPMQDMLIQQFNTGQNTTYGQGANIFGLGEDRMAGGTGVNADKQSQNQAQTLSGGGLWWAPGKDAFAGFRADQKNAEPGQQPAPQPQPQAQSQPAQAQIEPSQQTSAPAGAPQASAPNTQANRPFQAEPQGRAPRREKISDMMYGQYGGYKPQGGGGYF